MKAFTFFNIAGLPISYFFLSSFLPVIILAYIFIQLRKKRRQQITEDSSVPRTHQDSSYELGSAFKSAIPSVTPDNADDYITIGRFSSLEAFNEDQLQQMVSILAADGIYAFWRTNSFSPAPLAFGGLPTEFELLAHKEEAAKAIEILNNKYFSTF